MCCAALLLPLFVVYRPAVVSPTCFGRAAFMVELGNDLGAFLEQRRQMQVAARDRPRVVADLVVQRFEPLLQMSAHITIKSTNSFTGVCSSRFWSMHSSR